MPIRYRSTRSTHGLGSFQDILLEGLAPDGGLAVPEQIPSVPPQTIASWLEKGYAGLACSVLSCFADDIPTEDLDRLTRSAYQAEKFGGHIEIAPLRHLGEEGQTNIALLELSNGPTLAFKDMAMQMLGELFEYVLSKEGSRLNILGATSGDTGSAAEYAMRGRSRVAVVMLSPEGRMSAFQRAQMYSLQDTNIHNLSVPGSFDDCQDLVKAVSADLSFKQRHCIGSVNSINWARIASQVVYYFAAYGQAMRLYGLRFGAPISVSVPSGNFGNVLSGYVAKRMGLPIGRLVVATNENNVLDEFFKTGRYRPRSSAETHITSSPSMDISKASNFERYVFDVLGCDAARLSRLWEELRANGEFDLSDAATRSAIAQSGLVSGASHHAARLETIRDCHQRYQRVIDPHTADGLYVARQYLESGVPMICLETALPSKFEETIVEALGYGIARPAGLESIESLPQRVRPIQNDVELLKRYIAENTPNA